MAVTYEFTDDGPFIRLNKKVDAVITRVTKFNKSNFTITAGAETNILEVTDLRGSAALDYTDITLPASIDIDDLCSKLRGFVSNSILYDLDVGIALGLVNGAKYFTLLGNSDVISAQERTIWREPVRIVRPLAAAILQVQSTSINDTALGSGARTVQLIGLDGSHNVQQEIITMNGTTPVNTVLQYLRVNDLNVATVGSSPSNEGDITAEHTGDVLARTETDESVDDGINYTVPAGKKAVLFTPSIIADQNKIISVWLNINLINQVRIRRKMFGIAISQVLTAFDKPVFTAPEKTDISLTAVNGSGGNATVTAALQIIEVDV